MTAPSVAKANKAELEHYLNQQMLRWDAMLPKMESLMENLSELIISQREQSQSIAKLCEANADLVKRNNELQEKVLGLTTENEKLRSQTSKPPADFTYGKPPNFTMSLVKAMSEADQMKSKSLRAVIELLPEKEDDQKTVENDLKFITQIANKMNIQEAIEMTEIKRHGVKRENRHRILKIPFVTTANRDHFIRNFQKALKELPDKPNKLRVRRDMVESELTLLHELRKECYERNKSEGSFRYYVRDLEMAESKNPTPFKP